MKSIAYDLYYGITNASGVTRIAHARVWDGTLFLAAQREAGARAKDPADRFTISTATADDYRRANGSRHQ